jgi:cold shock CspA family protein
LFFNDLLRLGALVSFQITVLKILAGHPQGRASLADLRRAVAILISSGSDWTDRTKRLAARAPDLDIFSQSFVLRDDAGWEITDAGRAFLVSVEMPIQMRVDNGQRLEVAATRAPPPAAPPIRLIGINRRRPRYRAANRMPPSVAVA